VRLLSRNNYRTLNGDVRSEVKVDLKPPCPWYFAFLHTI